MRVLLAGQSGFIGQFVQRKLVAALSESAVVGLSRQAGFDLTSVSADLPKADVIINLAGRSGVMDSWDYPEEYFRTNFLSTLTLLEHARKVGARVVQMSSYMYGDAKSLPIDETQDVSFKNPYAASKLMTEELCRTYSQLWNIPVTILRPFNVYGPGESSGTVVGKILAQATIGDTIRVQSLSGRRDYVFVDDLAEVISRAAFAGHQGVEVFNVGTGKSYSVKDVIEFVQQILHRSFHVIPDQVNRPNEISDCFADSGKCRAILGYCPTTSLFEGLRRTLAVNP